MKLMIGRKVIPVTSYAEASAEWCRYRDDADLGNSNSPRVTLIEDDGTERNISYNGKVWPCATASDWRAGMVPLFDPYAEAKAG